MAISYPVSLPNTNIAGITMRLVRATGLNMSPFSFAQQVYNHAGARWEAEVTLPPMKRSDAAAWQGFILSLKGRYGTFLLGDSSATSPQGTATAARTNGAASAQATSLVVDNMGTSTTLKAGDFFQIGSGASAKLHMIVQDVTADGSGNATLYFEPPLRASVADNTDLTLSSPKGVFRLSADDIGWSIDTASIYGITFACMEAL